jgi:hypothetical protein
LRSAIDIFSHDDESNDLDIRSIYSADISLEDNESNNSNSDNSIYSADIPLEDYESNNSSSDASLEDNESNNSDINSIYSADISLEDYDLNEDVINDTNSLMDFGKIFNYLYIIQLFTTKLIYF